MASSEPRDSELPDWSTHVNAAGYAGGREQRASQLQSRFWNRYDLPQPTGKQPPLDNVLQRKRQQQQQLRQNASMTDPLGYNMQQSKCGDQ
jgi:hypothetical protein